MKIAVQIRYAGDFNAAVDALGLLQDAGLDEVFVPELYSFDAVSQLGYIAARNPDLQLTSGILQLYTRTPSLLAMTAAGIDYVSGGRFTLGIGASGPQVIEGFHGIEYVAPISLARDTIEICRQVWRREPLEYDGSQVQVPLPEGRGTGLGKPLKLIGRPVRSTIPIMLAAIGPKNVELAAERCERWLPIFFHQDRWSEVWTAPLAAGRARRQAGLPSLDIVASAPFAVVTDDEHRADLLHRAAQRLALYVGGMGAKGKNFYNNLAAAYGFADEAAMIQNRFLGGDKPGAVAAVPEDLVLGTSLIGTPDEIAERVEKYRAAGVGTLLVTPHAATPEGEAEDLRTLRGIVDDVPG